MNRNPLLEEIWRVREKHSSRFHDDLNLIFQDLKRQQDESGRIVVSFTRNKDTTSPNHRKRKSGKIGVKP